MKGFKRNILKEHKCWKNLKGNLERFLKEIFLKKTNAERFWKEILKGFQKEYSESKQMLREFEQILMGLKPRVSKINIHKENQCWNIFKKYPKISKRNIFKNHIF